MTSLHVICGLDPPPIKNPGYAYVSALLFVPPTLEVVVEIKRIFPLHSPIRGFHTMPFKVRLTMAFWQSQCVIFQRKKRNELLTD